MQATRTVMLIALGAAVAACASKSAPAVTTTSAGAPAAARRTDRNLLVTEGLSDAQLQLTVLQAVQQLKPHFLQGVNTAMTNNSSRGGLQVYMDGTRFGNASTLNDVRMYEIIDVRYLTGSEATNRFGTGNEAGALLLRRKK